MADRKRINADEVMVPCRSCGEMVSACAKCCPKCGNPYIMISRKENTMISVIVAIAVIVIGAIVITALDKWDDIINGIKALFG